MKYLLLAAGMLLAGCSSRGKDSKYLTSCARQRVHIYATNRSRVDTLVNFTLLINDSLILAQPIAFSEISSPDSIKVIRLCEGTHHMNVRFGRYVRDTTFLLKQATALVLTMNYDNGAYTAANGLAIATVIRKDTLAP